MSILDSIIQYLQNYWGDGLIGLFELTAIVIGIRYAKKDKVSIILISYLLLDFVILLVDVYLITISGLGRRQLSYFITRSNLFISIVELYTYYIFFKATLTNNRVLQLMHSIISVFILIVIIYFTTEFNFLESRYSSVANIISVIGFLILLIPCITFYGELIKSGSSTSLFSRPSFWIVTGIFFFSNISIPYFLLERFLSANKYEFKRIMDFSFFHFPLIINYIFISRAFLCRKALTI